LNRKTIFEWLFWMFLSVLIFTVGMSVALAAPVLVLLAPAPLMMLACRQGLREASLGSAAASMVVFGTLGPLPAIMFLVMFGLLGVMFGAAARFAKTGADFMVAAMTASILTKVAMLVFFTRVAGVNPFMITPEAASGMLKSIAGALQASGVSASQPAFQSYARDVVDTVTLLMPAMIVLFGAADTLACYAVSSKLLAKFGSKQPAALPPFGSWRFPRNIFWALLAAIVVDLSGKMWPQQSLFKMLSANLMEVLRAVFLVEGLSLCWYFMTKKGLHKALKVFLTAFCAFFSPVSYILSMVGIFDIWYDLRKRARRK